MRGANAKPAISPALLRLAPWTTIAAYIREALTRWRLARFTYLGGDGIFIDGESLLILSLLSLSLYALGLVDAREASVDRAGSWIEALLPCRCCVNDATVELDDGRDMSRPMISGLMDGSVLWSNAGGDVVLIAGRSNACSIDGLRNESWA